MTDHLTLEEHKLRHQQLHKALDELSTDFVRHNEGKLCSKITIMELIAWSYKQCEFPDKKE